MKTPKLAIKFPLFQQDPLMSVRLALIIVIGIILSVLIIFLYRDFYQTMVNARHVIVLKQEVSVENIDVAKFNEVLKTHNYKITSILPKIIADPFDTSQ